MTSPRVVHASPGRWDDPTPCCNQTRFELAWDDGLTESPEEVTCRANERPPCTARITVPESGGLFTCGFRVGHWDQYGSAHGSAKGPGGRFRWTDDAPGSVSHYEETNRLVQASRAKEGKA